MEHPIVEQAVKGNGEALTFLRTIARVLHFFDDAADGDRELTETKIHEVLWDSVVGLPTDIFYQQNASVLVPIVMQAIVNWRIATNVERDPTATPTDMCFAFIVRSTYVDLVTMSAMIVGGVEHAVAIGPSVRRWCHAEGFKGYLKNLAAERTAREARQAKAA